MSLRPLFDRFTFINRFVIDGEELGGEVDAFDDHRLARLDLLYPVAAQRILELGPLEGVQTIQLHQRGAGEIVSLEGRVDNVYKCCLIKNLYELDRAQFHLADLDDVDFRPYGSFGLCLCFGVLYHLSNPADLLQRLARVTSRVYIWTHVADSAYPQSPETTLEGTSRVTGQPYAYRGRYYREDLTEPRAALRADSFWAYEDETVRMLKDAGFDDVQVLERGKMYDKLPLVLMYGASSSLSDEPSAAPAESHAEGSVEGWLDRVDTNQVRGWAWLPELPSRRLRLRVSVDGRVVARPVASALRSDLRAAGKGDGCYGFSVTFRPRDGVKPGSVVRVVIEAGGFEIPGAPERV